MWCCSEPQDEAQGAFYISPEKLAKSYEESAVDLLSAGAPSSFKMALDFGRLQPEQRADDLHTLANPPAGNKITVTS